MARTQRTCAGNSETLNTGDTSAEDDRIDRQLEEDTCDDKEYNNIEGNR